MLKQRRITLILELTAIAAFSLLYSNTVNSQTVNQQISGIVIDKESKIPIPGATIVCETVKGLKTIYSDSLGRFSLTLPVGRHSLSFYAYGYSPSSFKDILLSSGKEVKISVEITELRGKIEQAVITGVVGKGYTNLNVSTRRVRSQDAARFAGGYYDPLRMVTNLPGVAATNSDENNSIVVRGNSPRGLLWRLEGLEIPNPNHLAGGQGGSGGAYSLITTNSISGFDFMTAAFPSEFSNAVSGVIDIALKNGNSSKREYSAGIGVIGAEVSVEGPLVKSGEASIFANVRYSNFSFLKTLKLVDLKYVAITPKAFDWAMKVSYPTKKAGIFELFTIGGESYVGDEINVDDESSQIIDKSEYLYRYSVGVAGLKHTYRIPGTGTFIRTVIGITSQKEEMEENIIDQTMVKQLNYTEKYTYPSLRASLLVNSKINKNHSLRATINANFISGNMFSSKNAGNNKYDTLLNSNAFGSYYNMSLQWKYKPATAMEFIAGLSAFRSEITNETLFEPRVSLKYNIDNYQEVALGFGLHSRLEPLSVYNYRVKTGTGTRDEVNSSLKTLKSMHLSFGYSVRAGENANVTFEAYFQKLYDIPSSTSQFSQYSIINSTYGLPDVIMDNRGEGYNSGIEFTVDKDFSKGYYFIFTSSLFDSRYKAPDSKWYSTYFNNNFIFNLIGGKEFTLGKSKQNIFGINFRTFLRGGYRFTPPDRDLSISRKRVVYDISKTYGKMLPSYFRADIGVSYRLNMQGRSWIFLLDIQNTTNRKNIVRNKFTYSSGKIIETYSRSIGMVPIISVKFEF
ncbi:MAG: carboxypeptidase regulatory-like domain-containing protein [Bacteroidales bacterium]